VKNESKNRDFGEDRNVSILPKIAVFGLVFNALLILVCEKYTQYLEQKTHLNMPFVFAKQDK